MSDSDHYRQAADRAAAAKLLERRRAHGYLMAEYARHGLDEEERDEILRALGIFTERDIDTHDLSVARALSTRGLTVNATKAVMPRKPPSRAV